MKKVIILLITCLLLLGQSIAYAQEVEEQDYNSVKEKKTLAEKHADTDGCRLERDSVTPKH